MAWHCHAGTTTQSQIMLHAYCNYSVQSKGNNNAWRKETSVPLDVHWHAIYVDELHVDEGQPPVPPAACRLDNPFVGETTSTALPKCLAAGRSEGAKNKISRECRLAAMQAAHDLTATQRPQTAPTDSVIE